MEGESRSKPKTIGVADVNVSVLLPRRCCGSDKLSVLFKLCIVWGGLLPLPWSFYRLAVYLEVFDVIYNALFFSRYWLLVLWWVYNATAGVLLNYLALLVWLCVNTYSVIYYEWLTIFVLMRFLILPMIWTTCLK